MIKTYNSWRSAHVEMTIHKQPCLLLEAIELVYSYVNGLPVEQLTGSGEFCIPAEEISRIRHAACQGVNPEDELVQFFFHGVPMGNHETRNAFLASHIFYGNTSAFFHNIDEMEASLAENWAAIQRPYVISEMDAHAVSVETCPAGVFRPFSKEVARLPVTPAYQAQFMELVYNYELYLHRLVELLRPVTERLDDLLAPWVQRADPLREKWKAFFQSEDADRFFEDRIGLNGMVCRTLELTLRYFPGSGGYLRANTDAGLSCIVAGVGLNVGLTRRPPEEKLTDKEVSALRLLANMDRMAMIRALTKAPKSCQELIQELDLNSGTVFRGLNNMADVQLLNRELLDGKISYRTNPDMLRKLARRLLQVAGVEPE